MKNDEGEGTNERMKIVIGYDGSEHAGAALDDLRQAGLPRDAEQPRRSLGRRRNSSP